jgi:hypothetical protein
VREGKEEGVVVEASSLDVWAEEVFGGLATQDEGLVIRMTKVSVMS